MDKRPIVVAYDGSAQARNALVWALDEGSRRTLPVAVVHVLDEDWRLPGPPEPGYRTDPRRHAETVVARTARDAYDWGRIGINVMGAVLDGPVARALCTCSLNASMVVMGDRGLGGFSGLRIGSMCLKVAAHAHCPVVVVRGNPAHHRDAPVVVGADDSREGRRAMAVAFDEAELRGVELIALRACSPARMARYAPEQQLLESLVDCWRSRHPRVSVTTTLTKGTAGHVLTVASRDAQLVVVGARGSGAFPGLRIGSVPQQLLHHALCTVMVIRGSDVLSPV